MRLAPWQHGLLSVGILILLIALVLVSVVMPLREAYVQRENTLNNLTQQVNSFNATAAEKTLYEAEINKIKQNLRQNQNFLTHQSASVAAADLQAHVKQLIVSHQGQLLSTQSIPGKQEKGLTPVTIRMELRCPINQLLPIVHGLESGKPLIYVNDLRLQSIAQRQWNRTNEKKENTPINLNVQFTLSRYMQAPFNQSTSP